ncbi:MAG: acetate--CoA ligase family protein [Acidimicrobiia bacterium]
MDRRNLARLLSPASIAVVGASENLGMSNNAVLPMLDRGRAVHLVNPNRDTLYGQPTHKSLGAIGEPVDAVLSLVSAERSIDVIAEAAAMGCGGVVVAAGGFAELGDAGRALQARLVEAAGGELAIVGPNCSGFMNVGTGANLFTGGRIELRAGGVAVISQSGFLLRSCLAAGQQRQLAFGVAVSSGNEAVCGLADYVSHLADDPHTRVILLVIEKIRDAEPFFEAVRKARLAGKAVVALKLGRTERSRDIMRSHTGAIANESWVYDLVLRQAGVVTADDIDDLLDKAQLLAQLPPERWGGIRNVAVMASSGGVAGVAADAGVEEGVNLPSLEPLEAWVRERIPGEDGSLNPLDLTGFVMRDRDLLTEMFTGYAEADDVDALILCWWAAEGDEGWAKTLLDPFADVAEKASVPLIVSPVEATSIGGWTQQFRERGVAFSRGLRSTYRAVRALDAVATAPAPVERPAAVPDDALPPPLLASEAGAIASFADSMRLLERAGVPVAPYVVLADGADDHPAVAGLGPRLVVKLADVPHRTELGAVRLGVAPSEVRGAVAELRAIASAHGVPATVAVQQMVAGIGEAFIGVQARTDLGPVLLFGRGGVLLEVAPRVDGRLLPLVEGAATSVVDEVAADVAGLRGQQAWPAAPLVEAVEAVARLWQATGAWLGSADLNPLVVTADGVVAVDALLVAHLPEA